MDSFKHSFKNTLKENLGLAVYNTGYQKCCLLYTSKPDWRPGFPVQFYCNRRGRKKKPLETIRRGEADAAARGKRCVAAGFRPVSYTHLTIRRNKNR